MICFIRDTPVETIPFRFFANNVGLKQKPGQVTRRLFQKLGELSVLQGLGKVTQLGKEFFSATADNNYYDRNHESDSYFGGTWFEFRPVIP